MPITASQIIAQQAANLGAQNTTHQFIYGGEMPISFTTTSSPSPATPSPPLDGWAIPAPDWSNNIFQELKIKETKPKKTGPEEKLYNLPLMKAFSRHLSGKVAEGEVGLEIECEGTNLFNTPVSYWSCHQDGSLRPHGDHPPIEYVLRKPIDRSDIPKALDYLTKKLKATGSTIDDSPRTSVHVHVNCQKMTLREVYQYICMYLLFEELLVDFSGPDRVGNLFCLRAKDAEYQVIVLEQAVQKEDYRELFSNELRYSSCNVASLGKFGSLEFRSMRGTVDQYLIQVWVDILLLLRDKALEYSSPKEIVEDFMRLQPDGFFKKVFDSRPDIQKHLHRGDVHTVMWDGLRLMRDVAYAVRWEKPLPKKSQSEEEELSENPEPLSPEHPEHPDRAYQGAVYIKQRTDAPGWYEVVNPTMQTRTFIRPGFTNTTIINPCRKYMYMPNGEYHSSTTISPDDI